MVINTRDMTEEIYKSVVGYEGFYEVSNLGNIRSLPRGKKGKVKQMKPTKQHYYNIDLCKHGEIKRWLMHRLIAIAFIPNPENKPMVNHIDGDKHNNRLDNLEWVTGSENQKHAVRIGIKSAKGIKNSSCKLTEKQVLEILENKSPYAFISEQYGVSISTVSDIKRGYSWSHLTGISR